MSMKNALIYLADIEISWNYQMTEIKIIICTIKLAQRRLFTNNQHFYWKFLHLKKWVSKMQ